MGQIALERPRQPSFTYLRQLCSSLKPRTSRILRFDRGPSNSPISRVTGEFGAYLARNALVGIVAVIVSLTALKTWKPRPSFFRQTSTIWPRSHVDCGYHVVGMKAIGAPDIDLVTGKKEGGQ